MPAIETAVGYFIQILVGIIGDRELWCAASTRHNLLIWHRNPPNTSKDQVNTYESGETTGYETSKFIYTDTRLKLQQDNLKQHHHT